MRSIIIPTILFVITMTATPGPNNMLLTASGARFGYLRSLPFVGGIVLGITSQLILSSLGLGVLFLHYPFAQTILKIIGCVYIIFLSTKIAFSGSRGSEKNQNDKPMGFLEGAMFQYLNPKAYLMTITAMSVYPLKEDLYIRSAVFIITCFLFITPVSTSLWAGFGSLVNRSLDQEKYGRILNIILGGLTAVSVVFIVK